MIDSLIWYILILFANYSLQHKIIESAWKGDCPGDSEEINII